MRKSFWPTANAHVKNLSSALHTPKGVRNFPRGQVFARMLALNFEHDLLDREMVGNGAERLANKPNDATAQALGFLVGVVLKINCRSATKQHVDCRELTPVVFRQFASKTIEISNIHYR